MNGERREREERVVGDNGCSGDSCYRLRIGWLRGWWCAEKAYAGWESRELFFIFFIFSLFYDGR